MYVFDILSVFESICKYSHLPVNWLHYQGLFKTVYHIFYVHVFGMSFYISSGPKKSDSMLLYCVLDKFNAIKST